MGSLLRDCRRFFAAAPMSSRRDARRSDVRPAPASESSRLFREHPRQFATAQVLVRAFYVFLLYLASLQLTELGDLTYRPFNLPLWPVAWLEHDGEVSAFGVQALFFFYIGSNVLAALLPGWRSLRMAACLGLLEYVALKYSFGKIGHSFHLPLLVSALLVFLPDGWDQPAPRTDRRLRQSTLLVFWMCQAAVLLSYTMSGLGKLGGALYQVATRQLNVFQPGALGSHVALRLFKTHSESILGAWIIHHPWLTWPLMPVVLYLELFSWWVAFRPALQRFWAAILVSFHFGTFFTMAVTFPQNCFLLGLLFFSSPFTPDRQPGWQTLVSQLPVLGHMFSWVCSLGTRVLWRAGHRTSERLS